MKIRNIVSKIAVLPKSMIALLLITLFSVPLVAGFVSAANQVLMEGNTTALNVTAGETQYKDSTNLKVDEVAQVQLWQHNREVPTGEKANNTVARFNVPTTPGKSQIITGSTTSDNSNAISDTTLINLSLDKARVEYITGTAKFRYNKGAAGGDVTCQTGLNFAPERCYATVGISDDVVKGGVNLDKVRGGPLNGCNAFHETVTIQIRSKADVVSVNKYVRHVGQTSADWATTATAKPGDDLEYMIKYKNEGNTQLNNIMVGDNLPKYNKYVGGTTKLQNGNFPTGTTVASDNVTTGGINTGNYLPGAVGYVWFKVKLDSSTAFEKCGDYDIRNVGVVRPEGMNEFYNTAQVIIKVECKPTEQKKPSYSCDLLKLENTGGRSVNLTASASAKDGANVKRYVYTFGDGGEQTTDKNVVSHTYAKDGKYVATVKVQVAVGNEVVTAESDKCAVVVEFTTPDTPTTPTTPGSLPDTGAGSVVTVFMAVTVISSLGYTIVARRFF